MKSYTVDVDPIKTGQKLKICGYPGKSRSLVCRPYYFESYHGFALAGKAHIVPGDSGSPLMLNDTDVIGVMTHVSGEYSFAQSLLGFLP